MFGGWVDVQDSPREVDPSIEMPGFDVVVERSFDDFQVRGVKPISIWRCPFLVLEIERKRPTYASTKLLTWSGPGVGGRPLISFRHRCFGCLRARSRAR